MRETEGERESSVREKSWALMGMENLGVDMYPPLSVFFYFLLFLFFFSLF